MSETIFADTATRWPGGHCTAVIFNLAYEGWSDGVPPGIGPMGNPLPGGVTDHNALSWGRYGEVAGIQRLLNVLERTGISADVMVSGILARRQPDQVKAIAAGGHQIVAHGYAQEIIPAGLDAEADRANIDRTTEIIEQVTGQRPDGWLSPRFTSGPQTIERLRAAGYVWHGDCLDADLPYVQRLPAGQMVAVPFTMDINDLPHAMRFGRTPRQYVELFEDIMEKAVQGPDGPRIIDVTAHAHCYGRPATSWAFEAIARACAERNDIWITTRAAIARHVLATAMI